MLVMTPYFIILKDIAIEKAISFWNDYVLKDSPPPATSIADCQTLFSKGNPNESTEATFETVELTKHLHLLNCKIEVREEEVSKIKQNIMQIMGEAEILSFQGKH